MGSLLPRRRQDLGAVCIHAKGKAPARSPSLQTARPSCGRPRTGRSPIQRTGARPGPRRGNSDADTVPDWAPVHFRPAADRVNPKKFYVLDAKGGQAYKSTDGGAHFTASPAAAKSSRLPAQFGLGPGRTRIEGDVWLTNFKGAQSLDRFGKDLRDHLGRDRGVCARFGQAGRRQEVSGFGISMAKVKDRGRLLTALTTPVSPG